MLVVSKTQVEKHQFLVKRGVTTNVFSYNLCFVNSEKLSFLGAHFLNFLLMFKKHYKIGTSAHVKRQKMTILKGYFRGQVRV